jgi:hypothetical protein
VAAFCDALAVLLALKLGGAAPGVAPSTPAAAAAAAATGATAASPPPPAGRLESTVVHTDGSLEGLRANSIARAAIGVIKLPEWPTAATRPPDSAAQTEMDAIVRAIRAVIDRSDLSYAAQFDDEIVIAACSAGEVTAARDAQCVATVLLEVRDALMKLEEKWRAHLDFRFAIDVGTVMKSDFGGTPSGLNLWGGAISVAKLLLTAAAEHAIATSEAASALLSDQFLLRPHSAYYLPETGSTRTFTLAGRL